MDLYFFNNLPAALVLRTAGQRRKTTPSALLLLSLFKKKSSIVLNDMRHDGPQVVRGFAGEGVEVGVGVAFESVAQGPKPQKWPPERSAHLRHPSALHLDGFGLTQLRRPQHLDQFLLARHIHKHGSRHDAPFANRVPFLRERWRHCRRARELEQQRVRLVLSPVDERQLPALEHATGVRLKRRHVHVVVDHIDAKHNVANLLPLFKPACHPREQNAVYFELRNQHGGRRGGEHRAHAR
mmetsp:Transcript_69662/g.140184  ORF Transcript_69662/g.140184 Transcript_69662/m.140184 type:complete len:239 (+) Transcript_69662:135-851(+)